MKRRAFFKAVTGFVAGVCVAFVPRAKAKAKYPKRSGMKFIAELPKEQHPFGMTPNEELICKIAKIPEDKWPVIVLSCLGNGKDFDIFLNGKRIEEDRIVRYKCNR